MSTSAGDRLQQDYDACRGAEGEPRPRRVDETFSTGEVFAWLGSLAAGSETPTPRQDAFLAALLAGQRRSLWGAGSRPPGEPAAPREQAVHELCGLARKLYPRLPAGGMARGQLLALLAAGDSPAAQAEFVELVTRDPPEDARSAGVAFSPLFQHPRLSPERLFPGLLSGLSHRVVATSILDLANYLVRNRRGVEHPAAGRAAELLQLLEGLVAGLSRLEQTFPEGESRAAELAQTVNESIALAVSLCDALALIGDSRAVGKLQQALDLPHRRLRTEAAAALARLGDERGRESLAALAAEPVARLRVLAYAQELGLEHLLAEEFRSPVAVAEAELAAWLSESTQLGLAPSRCELYDARTLYWPGYDDPRNCYLFRFTYDLGGLTYANIGIAGPLTHAFTADLTKIPADDVYAAFAGWSAEHPEIFELPPDRWSAEHRRIAHALERRLEEAGYEGLQSLWLGHLFGTWALVSRGVVAGQPGNAVVDAESVQWLPEMHPQRPLGPDEAFSIYKGRKLLAAFNT